jgi:hypothetical protein
MAIMTAKLDDSGEATKRNDHQPPKTWLFRKSLKPSNQANKYCAVFTQHTDIEVVARLFCLAFCRRFGIMGGVMGAVL